MVESDVQQFQPMRYHVTCYEGQVVSPKLSQSCLQLLNHLGITFYIQTSTTTVLGMAIELADAHNVYAMRHHTHINFKMVCRTQASHMQDYHLQGCVGD